MTSRDDSGAAALARLQVVLDELATINVSSDLLESLPVGPALASVLLRSEPALLDPEGQLAFVEASQRLINGLEARRDGGIVAFVGSNPRYTSYWVKGDERRLTDVRATELALALRWSDGVAHQRIDSARAQAHLPATTAAFEAGLLSSRTVDTIATGMSALTSPIDDAIATAIKSDCDPEQVEELRGLRHQMLSTFDDKVSAFAVQHNSLRVGDKIRNTIAALDPQGAAARRVIAARVESNVELRLLPDGLAQLTAILAAEQALSCMRTLDDRARDGQHVDLTDPIGLRRAQALVHFVTRPASAATSSAWEERDDRDATAAPTPLTPKVARSSVGMHLDVVMDLPTFLGLAETPALLVGAGPLPANAARDLLADSAFVRIRRVIVDPVTGHRLDTGVKRYLLTDAERDRIFARDMHCRFPDCNAPAYRCECDHALPYDRGGATSTDNLGAACKKHHQHKTHAGWQVTTSAADGSCIWRSPLGRSYVHEAQAVLPWTLDADEVVREIAARLPGVANRPTPDAKRGQAGQSMLSRADFEAIYDKRQGHIPNPNGCSQCMKVTGVLRHFRELAWAERRRMPDGQRRPPAPASVSRSWLEVHVQHSLGAPTF